MQKAMRISWQRQFTFSYPPCLSAASRFILRLGPSEKVISQKTVFEKTPETDESSNYNCIVYADLTCHIRPKGAQASSVDGMFMAYSVLGRLVEPHNGIQIDDRRIRAVRVF
jgi:hypothetical protein